MKWFFQKSIFEDEETKIIDYLKDYQFVDSVNELPQDINNCVIRGSVDFLSKIPNYKHFQLQNYDCSKYYYYYFNQLLNSDFLFIPWFYLNKCDYIFKSFDCEEFFIRPNSGNKCFTGTTLTKKWWSKELEIIKNLPWNNIQENEMIVVSSKKEIISEYRLLYYKDKFIDYSIYFGENIPLTEKEILKIQIEYIPNDFFTLDLARTKNGIKILEINGFFTAGLYNMNYEKVVLEIEKNWK